MAPRPLAASHSGIPKSGSLPSLALLARASPSFGQTVAWPERSTGALTPQRDHFVDRTPSFSAGCGSHFTVSGEKQLAPLAVGGEKQLAPPTAGGEKQLAPLPSSPSRGWEGVECELKPREYRELFLEVLGMGFGELGRLGRRVNCLKARDGSKLRRAFRTRAAELLGAAPLADLDRAAHALAVLQEMDEVLPCEDFWAESDAWPKSSSADPTSWQSPSRAFEERIGKLVFQHRSQVDVLERCYEVTDDLVAVQLLRPRALEPVRSCLVLWAQRAPLQELRRRVTSVRRIVSSDPGFLASLEQRLLQRIRDSFSAGQLPGFSQLLLDLQAGGLALLEGVGPHELDPASGKRLPPLQLALLAALRGGLARWPMRRLAAEICGPTLELARACDGALPEICVAAGARVAEGLRSAHAMILREVLPTRVQEELLDWGRLLSSLSGAGMLLLQESERLQVLESRRDPGSLLNCQASVTPGLPELVPAYRARAQEIQPRAKEVNDMVVAVFALLGGSLEDRASSAPAGRRSRR